MVEELIDKKNLLEIAEIEKEIFANTAFSMKQLEEMKEIERYRFFITKIEEKVAGYIILYDTIDVWEIMKIAVNKEYRRKGIGEKMIKYIFSLAQIPIMLEVRENNKGAIEFYKKSGFELIATRKNYYTDTGETAYIMVKN
ncbi:ribosomal protein S18-alanine N-acetyltransferase [Fusobacterium sp.]|uniref:ribosomal protein S18-alanine N-acetyltransferase n=1 Tax=Fusobacterium sp. TaxID=68766 RepID=UPI0029042F35|nr:ribosomal protein S18-alanine N-acetyltransferase [Fusobacterium sp.]MDU1910641.1 ribosomal protein S18-alanine N-acetyltransferase [Fusobacterium sp.]